MSNCNTGGCGCNRDIVHDPEVELALQLANEKRFNEAVDRGHTMKVLHVIDAVRAQQRREGKAPFTFEQASDRVSAIAYKISLSGEVLAEEAMLQAAEAVERMEVIAREMK